MWFKTRIKIYVSVLILNLLIASILIYLVSKVNEENLYKEALNYKYIEKFKVPEFYRVYFNESDKNIHFNNDLDSMFNLNDSEALEIKWTKEYTQSYGRTPPTNYKKWISFAINKKVKFICRIYKIQYFFNFISSAPCIQITTVK